MKSYVATPKTIEHQWLVIDATDKVLGRLATEVATLLTGKHKPTYTPFMDTGDYVIIINAEKVRVTGNKEMQKNYYHHTGYPGGLKEISFAQMMEKHPERIIEHAVKGMLPKNRLGRQMYRKLRVYQGSKHGHEAQQPEIHNF